MTQVIDYVLRSAWFPWAEPLAGIAKTASVKHATSAKHWKTRTRLCQNTRTRSFPDIFLIPVVIYNKRSSGNYGKDHNLFILPLTFKFE